MWKLIALYMTIYAFVSHTVYIKYKNRVPENKLYEFTFRIAASFCQLYIVTSCLGTLTIIDVSDESLIAYIALPIIAYFFADSLSLCLYCTTLGKAAPFIFHHIAAISLGFYGVYSSSHYRELIRVIVLLFESTAFLINFKWCTEYLSITHKMVDISMGWFVLICWPLFRLVFFFIYLLHIYSSLTLQEVYVTVVFTILITIFNVFAVSHVIKFALDIVMPIKEITVNKH
jgi:hypothetical protein